MPYQYLYRGHMIFVSDGISGGRAWGAFYRHTTGALRRFKSLPMRETREQAQHDLDEWAKAKHLVPYPYVEGNERR